MQFMSSSLVRRILYPPGKGNSLILFAMFFWNLTFVSIRLKPNDSTTLMRSISVIPNFVEIKQGLLGNSALKFGLIGVSSENEGIPRFSLRKLSTDSEDSTKLDLIRIEFLIPVDILLVSFFQRELRLKTD